MSATGAEADDRPLMKLLADTGLACSFIGLIAVLLRLPPLNPTTAALVLLVTVLLLSAWRGTAAGILGSLLATALLNFFFLPPLHTWNVEDPGNWLALGCFLAASILAGQLVAKARRSASIAEMRRAEVEAMYQLSVGLFKTTRHPGRLDEAAQRTIDAFDASGGGLVLFDGSFYRQKIVWWRGNRGELDEDLVAGAGRHHRIAEFPPAAAVRDVYVPLAVGGRPDAVLVLRRTSAHVQALENAATLLALAAERERLFEEQAHIEALRESERLKTSLLRAVSHDLASPLTALTLHASRIRRVIPPGDRRAVEALEMDLGRLRRRIDKLLAFARLEAGVVAPSPEPTPPADLLRSVRENLPTVEHSRPIQVRVEADCPDLFVDPSLALEVLVNLVENADAASPAGAPLILGARRVSQGNVAIEVEDCGPGVDEKSPQRHSADTVGEGHPGTRGLGLEIVAGLLESIGGTISFERTSAGRNAARVMFPAVDGERREEEPCRET